MQKIFNIILVTAMMLFIISCSDDSNSVELNKKVTNSMVLIPAGTFQMGNTGAFTGYHHEKPVHTVTISKAFYMSKYEVTQSQYEKVMGINPSAYKGENLPVEQVSWNDAIAFCNALSLQDKKTPCYTVTEDSITCNWDANGYRLPTEAEWEYACKAGTKTDFYSGNMINSKATPIDDNLDSIGCYCGNVGSGGATHPVGKKQPNTFGLYDMSGNVCEWCWDWYADYSSTAVTPPTDSSGRVIRGGMWGGYADFCRSAFRNYYNPVNRGRSIGFRIVRVD